MGVNNRRRRAAKQRKRAGQRAAGGTSGAGRAYGSRADPSADAHADLHAFADLMVTSTVRRISGRSLDAADLREQAEMLLRRVEPAPRRLVESALTDLLVSLVGGVLRGGWGRADLAELVRRRAGSPHLPTLDAALHESPRAQLHLGTVDGLASGLQVAALLATAPLLDAAALTTARASDGPEHPKLARVRALLAKAESTEFDEEAEALSAKAQELITRHALDRLLDRSRDQGGLGRGRGDDPQVRRLWLDAPYVRAKAALVDEAARANRCRTALAESVGFVVVVGTRADIDAVELLTTSLLVQANTALIRHGRRIGHGGRSRTRSFRQSFLFAYADRIGQRLQAAAVAAATPEETQRLLPVLRDHDATVSAAFEAMVPHTVGRASRITDGEGWAAGQVAAELALLDVNGKIAPGQD